MKKSIPKSKPIDKDDLCYQEEVEEIGLCDFIPEGKPVAQFIFDNNPLSNEPMIKTHSAESKSKVSQEKVSKEIVLEQYPKDSLNSGSLSKLPDHRTLKSEVNGITPPIDGEYFEIKRGFTFRRSTIRMLNQIKAADLNENIYLSTIVDAALRHYHEYIFKEKGSKA